MIEASFDRDTAAAAVGAYQYDTGQRLRMHGLPSPGELAARDECLSGGMVTMQVHFGCKGDSQTQPRLALWNEAEKCWIAAIPDEYLTAAQSVYAYVYVSYGADEAGGSRAKTMYELVFRPIARPAPNNVATAEQWEAWAVKKEELALGISVLEAAASSAQNAAGGAQAAMESAQEAAGEAQAAADAANEQAQRLEKMQQSWQAMTPVTVSRADGQATAGMQGGILTLGLPRGETGAKGEQGETGPADIALAMEGGVLTITLRE